MGPAEKFLILSLLHILIYHKLGGLSVSASSITCETGSFPPNASDEVPSFILDLDTPPRLRWTEIIKDKTEILKNLFDDVKQLIESLAGKRIFKFIYSQIHKILEALPSPYREEIEGIAEASRLPLEDVTVYNIFYEFYVLCTSIIVQDSHGNILHGRNLDNGALLGWDTKHRSWKVTEYLKPLTVQLDWRSGGKTVFKSVSFAGFVGVLTAVKKNKFSLTIDKRLAVNNGLVGLFEWMILHDHTQHWVTFLAREVLETADSFETAKNSLATSRLLAPVYYILAGINQNEGVIITRDRDNVRLLPLGSPAAEFYGSWYLIETNYDYWKSPPFFDNRRTPAKYCLDQAHPSNASFSLLYNVLSTKPVLNKSTVYTSLMHAKNGTIGTWIRHCPDPCFPW